MLEMFFDNEKVFSFFEALLRNGEKTVECPRILYELGVSPQDGADILRSFVFLGILSEKDLDKGLFEFNPFSDVSLAICIFDDIVGTYVKKQFFDEGENDDYSFKDAFYNEKGISFEEIMDILGEQKGSFEL